MQSNTRWSLGYVALQVLSQVMKQAIPCILLLLKCIFFSCNLFSDDPAVLPGSCWLRRFQQLGLILQLLMQGQSYLVPCKSFPYCYQNVYAATQFNLLRQNCLSADKKQPGLLCCCNPNPRSPKSWASPRIKPCSTQAERNLWEEASVQLLDPATVSIGVLIPVCQVGFLTKPNPSASAPLPRGSSFSYFSSGCLRCQTQVRIAPSPPYLCA